MKAFYKIEISGFQTAGLVDPNGVYYKVKFKDGIAFLDWRKRGEHENLVAAQLFGHDPRFQVTEILESDLPPAAAPQKKKRNVK